MPDIAVWLHSLLCHPLGHLPQAYTLPYRTWIL